MNRQEILSQMKSQRTWRLVFLNFITLGIYAAYYIKRQTTRLNQYLDDKHQILVVFVRSILILAYTKVIMIIPYVLLDETYLLNIITHLLDLILSIFIITWAFKAKNRMNMLLGFTREQPQWFWGFTTFLFSVFYFNFKINKLIKSINEQGDFTDS